MSVPTPDPQQRLGSVRRQSISMSDDEVRDFLEEQRILNVATIGVDGRPHLVAMWFAWFGDEIGFWTFAKSQKVLNIRRDPRLTCLAESGDSYDRLCGVELIGRARIVSDRAGVVSIAERVAAKYGLLGEGRRDLPAHMLAQVPKRVGILIEVERTVSWDHRHLTSGRNDGTAP
jgi:PPOX class probable F420-dependent enzyme